MRIHPITSEQIQALKDKWVHQEVRILTGEYKDQTASIWHLMFRVLDGKLTPIVFIDVQDGKDRSHRDAWRYYIIDTELELVEES